jgi:hypothetical protein
VIDPDAAGVWIESGAERLIVASPRGSNWT